jgi:hypothetical protein
VKNRCQAFAFHKRVNLYRYTQGFDMSILTHTIAGCAPPIVTFYIVRLIRRDVNAWLRQGWSALSTMLLFTTLFCSQNAFN